MKKYSCIIVDDESLAQDLLEAHLEKIPNINIVAKCHTAMIAMQVLNEYPVDIMFLDIEMPDLNGIHFLKSLEKTPYTIFTTAYSQYALESYELNVVDYLLKPIRFDRFFKAITKVLSLLNSTPTNLQTSITEQKNDYFFVKSDYKSIKIQFNNIVYIESAQKYVKIFVNDKCIMPLMSLSSIMGILPTKQFFRCHKSFIVNLDVIECIDGNQLLLTSGDKIPVSKTLKAELISKIDHFNQL